MKTFHQRRPVYRAHQFMGLNDVDDLKLVANTESYTITSDTNGDLTICIAHWHIPQGSWLVKDNHGICRVLNDLDFKKEFEETT